MNLPNSKKSRWDEGVTFAGGRTVASAELNNVRWVSHCRHLVRLPEAA